jgi:hypothetical protein
LEKKTEKSMKKRLPKVQNQSDFEKKNTKALLAYLKQLQHCEASFEASDMDVNPDILDTETIYFKVSEKWKFAYSLVKSILNKREHIL